jgi:hypothetical protein
VTIFVIISYILCQFIASIPVSVKPLQSHDVKISADHQINEKNTDAYKAGEFPTYNTYKVYDATAEFPAYNTNSTYNSLSNTLGSVTNFFSDIHNSIVKFFSPMINFIRNHLAISIGAIVIIVLIFVCICMPFLITWLIRAIGFAVGGIVKGSYAAIIMASQGGKVTFNSACAILQSAGELGVKGFGGLIKLILRLIY